MRVLPLLAILLACAPAWSQKTPFDERFSLTVGAFRASLATDVRVDGTQQLNDLIGDSIRLEEQLDLDERDTIARMDGWFRVADRHRIGFSVIRLNRSAQTTLREDIRFGDSVFELDAQVRGRFDIAAYDLLYRYSLLKNERTEMDLSLGVHAIRARASVSTLDNSVAERAEGTGPLPLLGFGVNHAITDSLFLSADGRWLRAKVGSLDGRVFDTRAGLDYRLGQHFALGAHYNYFKLYSDIDKRLWNGTVDFLYRGPQLSATLRF